MGRVNKIKLPPGPKPKFPLAHLFSFQRDSLAFLKTIANDYGDIAHFRIGPLRVVLLNHPEFVKEVLTSQHKNFVKGRPLEMSKEVLGEGLLTSEGAFHDRQHRLIQPMFHRNMMDTYTPVIADCTKRLLGQWEDGLQVDMMQEMTRLSINIAGKIFFNADLEEEASEINQALTCVARLFGKVAIPFSESWLKLPLPGNRQFFNAKARLVQTIDRLIAERRNSHSVSDDLLSILLQAQEHSNPQPLTDQQVRDEALTMFLTAFDTTSIALTWTWYLLAQHPGVEERLYGEVTTVLGSRFPDIRTLPTLNFTRSVFGESMRLYPPLYLIAREARGPFTIGNYVIPGRTLMLMSPYLIHRDPRFYHQPECFDPGTWEVGSKKEGFKYRYFPFGGGPRACIGQPLAWLEGTFVLAALAQSWRMELLPGYRVEKLQLINLRPKHGLPMILRRRKSDEKI